MEKQDSMHEKYVNQKVDDGLADIDEGAVYTQAEARVYLKNKKDDLNGWCRNCDNREECKHLNLPSCEEFMFRTDGEDFDSTGFIVVERKDLCHINNGTIKDDIITLDSEEQEAFERYKNAHGDKLRQEREYRQDRKSERSVNKPINRNSPNR